MDIAGRRLLLLVPMITMIIDLVLMTICRVLHVRGHIKLSSDVSFFICLLQRFYFGHKNSINLY